MPKLSLDWRLFPRAFPTQQAPEGPEETSRNATRMALRIATLKPIDLLQGVSRMRVLLGMKKSRVSGGCNRSIGSIRRIYLLYISCLYALRPRHFRAVNR